MKYLSSIVVSSLLLGAAATGCGGASTTSTSTTGDATAELTPAQRDKLDSRLASRIEEGAEPLPVRVRFTVVPSDAELADLLLTRVGGVVVGQVSRDALLRIVARDDVEQVEYVSDAGYEGEAAGKN